MLFDALPDVLLLDFDELPAWLSQATDAIRDELTWQRPGFRAVALRQAELAVLNLIRHYIASHTPTLPAWISLPDHSRVAAALREFHRDISRPWTLEMLAERADLHANYVGAVERGERNLSLYNVWRLANGLGLSASDLVRHLY